MERKKWQNLKECAKVVSQERIGTGIFSLWLQTEQVAGEAKPGQFINLYCQDGSPSAPETHQHL